MQQLNNLGNELLEINTYKNTIEGFQKGGRLWGLRCNNTLSYGDFISLQENGSEPLVSTIKGLYCSFCKFATSN